ncbi:ATP-dependent metallopeptidase FtsH/Yme1/Tma family protein [Candidatus Saccharibacteria bacterium]|nr:ATP-dependent metallopeptidase FtsH/Yme1/Tma family protein [Candidatus Saccharibacteria bacterium]
MRGFIFLALAILVLAVLGVAADRPTKTKTVDISQVIQEAKNGDVKNIQVDGNKLTITLKDSSQEVQVSSKEDGTSLVKDYGIDPSKVAINVKNSAGGYGNTLLQLALAILPVLAILFFVYWLSRQAQGQGNQAMNFGKSRARLYAGDKAKVVFKDVAGSDEAKQELEEIVEFLKYPTKFEALGAKIPKGVLLFGPPGTGKTLLARAVAGEAGVPFFSISGSDFVEMFVGVGASRVRDLFMKAKKNAPCIIFIDEIDAVGRQRGTGMGGGHDEREQTLNQILVEMDGFEQGTNVIVIAATNRPDVLDPALLRPGRFDRRVTLDAPDLKSRKAILEVHSKGKPLVKTTDLEVIARKTPGFSGADLSNLMNEAAILAARNNKKEITQQDLSLSVEKVLLGPERKTHMLSEREREIAAYHEAGHAVVGHALPFANPIHKVTIVSRGGAGGVTWSLPEEDKYMYSVKDFKDDLAQSMGGRMAEEVVFGSVTNGASNDFQKATGLARRMVMDYGMSETLGNRVFGSQTDTVFLGRDMAEGRAYSEDIARQIDSEVAKLIDEASARAKATIIEHRDAIDKVAKKLIEVETIDAEDFAKIAGFAKANPPKSSLDPRVDSKHPTDIGPDITGSPATI